MTKKELEQKVKNLELESENNLATANKGYAQAYEIIKNLRDRLEKQKEEYEAALERGYEEAYQMLLKERKKNDDLEIRMYEEYDCKLKETKDYIIDKFDQFLDNNGYDKNDAEAVKQEIEEEFPTHKNVKIDLSGKNEI